MQHTASRTNGRRTRTGGLTRNYNGGASTAATYDDPGTELHARAATMAQIYGNPDENESDEDGNGLAPGNGGSTAERYWSADFGVGRAWGESPRARAGLH